MKAFRVFVVLLLAVLVPLRGAVAATMLCAESGDTGQSAAAVSVDHHGMHGGHAHDGAHHDHVGHGDPVDSPDAAGSQDDGTPGHGNSCPICASGCHALALATSVPSVPGPLLTSRAAFPALSVPAPAFLSDGQERPPRTI